MVEKIIETIKSIIDIELIYIFGSYGTERYNFDSDIDIAILANKEIDFDILRKIKWELIQNTGNEIDLIDLNNCGIVIKKEILSKGKIVFEKEKGIKNQFEYRVFSLYGQYIEDIDVIKKKIKERGKILCKK